MSSQGQTPNNSPETYVPEAVGSIAVPEPRMASELGSLTLEEQLSALKEENSALRLALAEKDILLDESKQQIRTLTERLEEAYVHPIMGIPNRKWFEEFSESIENPREGREKPINLTDNDLVFGVIDVDSLKPVNDTLGHLAGDQLLHAIAQSVRGSIREINNDKVVQLGGDEIGVAIPIAKDKITEETPLSEILEEIKQRISSELEDNMRTSKMAPEIKAIAAGVSIGFSLYKPGEKVKDAVERADKAMYVDKEARRDARKLRSTTEASIGGIVLNPQGDSILE